MEAISYELIRKIQREEQSNPKLTKLPENFIEKVRQYIQLKKEAEKEERKVAAEIKNVERLIKSIFLKRERKIVEGAMKFFEGNIVPENMNEEEKEFFNKIVEVLKERRERIFGKIFETKEFAKLIIFKEDIPEFVGINGKTYGPFKKGDIAKLSEEDMKILVEKNLAEEFEIGK